MFFLPFVLPRAIIQGFRAAVVQWITFSTPTRKIVGSTPAGRARKKPLKLLETQQIQGFFDAPILMVL
jgi:hypothetical protein